MTRSTSGAAQAPAFLALACVGAFSSVPAMAAEPDPAKDGPAVETSRNDIVVTGAEQEKPKQAGAKTTRALVDTPQTVTVISREQIEQQNLLTLRDVLSTVPGITFGAGEGGGGYGDSITLRGYSANTDITVDNVRDSAQYSRTDPFNLEQIEVVNGANSVYSGSGSVGGSINIVSKRPLSRDQTLVSAGIGTDDYYRGTIDANMRVGKLAAFRINAMAHKNRVPGRDVEDYQRWGIAPSLTLGIDSPTKLTLQYLHQQDTNIPQYGLPYYENPVNSGLIPGADRSSYYGYRNVDTQKIRLDQATATFEHAFNDRVSVRNLTRWQRVGQLARVDPPQGTWCLAAGVLPTANSAGTANAACPATVPAGYYQPSGPRGNVRDSVNDLAYNQLDLRADFDTGGLKHSLVVGASAAWEKYYLSTGNILRNANGTTVTLPLINIANPNAVVTGPTGFTYGSNSYQGPLNYIESGRQTGELTNYAAYLFDTVVLAKGLELNGGLRIERNSGYYRADTVSAATATLGQVTTGQRFDNADTLFSYRAGLVYKPVQAVSLYVAYGNSQTPSKTSVNGSCTVASCNVDPESGKSYEVGAKAELFKGGLLLSAALFRNERDKYKVASNDPILQDQVLDGRSRVQGIALSATGHITPHWTVTANYTYLEGKLIQSVSDYCLSHPGGTGCGNSANLPDPGRGAQLANTPKHSGSAFTTYTLPFGLTLGYGVTYQGSFAFGVPALIAATQTSPATLGPVYHSKAYWLHSAYASYAVTRRLSLQVNVKNIADELYFTRIRNNGWATAGEARSAILTANYKF